MKLVVTEDVLRQGKLNTASGMIPQMETTDSEVTTLTQFPTMRRN